MTTLDATAAVAAAPNDLQRFGAWLSEGGMLFCRAPLRLFSLVLAMLVVEGLVQLAVPTVGMLVSKWLVAMMGGVSWLMLTSLADQGCLHPLRAIGRVRGKWPGLALLSLIQLAAFGVQVGVAWMLLGTAGMDLLIRADPTDVSSLHLGLILAAGIPISTLLLFTMPRLLLDRQATPAALFGGIKAVWRHLRPLSLMALVTTILVGLAPATYLLSVLLAAPLIVCTGFAAYRDAGRAQ